MDDNIDNWMGDNNQKFTAKKRILIIGRVGDAQKKLQENY